MPDTAEHALAKQAAELWTQACQDSLSQITAGAEGLLLRASAYEDRDSVADEVRALCEAIRAIVEGAREATVAVQDISIIRGLEVAGEAMRAAPAPGEGEQP